MHHVIVVVVVVRIVLLLPPTNFSASQQPKQRLHLAGSARTTAGGPKGHPHHEAILSEARKAEERDVAHLVAAAAVLARRVALALRAVAAWVSGHSPCSFGVAVGPHHTGPLAVATRVSVARVPVALPVGAAPLSSVCVC